MTIDGEARVVIERGRKNPIRLSHVLCVGVTMMVVGLGGEFCHKYIDEKQPKFWNTSNPDVQVTVIEEDGCTYQLLKVHALSCKKHPDRHWVPGVPFVIPKLEEDAK